MATKTQAEILAAHKKTIEVFTGHDCEIILTSKEDLLLKKASLATILFCCETANKTDYPVNSETVNREVVQLKKIFCIIASKAGFSAKKIGFFLGKKDHTGARYNLLTGKKLLEENPAFKKIYDKVQQDVISIVQRAGY